MNDSNFDQLFRDKLGNHATPVDTEAIWNGVQAGMAGKSTKNGAYWKWLLPLLILLIGISGGVTWYGLGDKKAEVVEVANEQSSETDRKGLADNHSATAVESEVKPHQQESVLAQVMENETVNTRGKADETTTVFSGNDVTLKSESQPTDAARFKATEQQQQATIEKAASDNVRGKSIGATDESNEVNFANHTDPNEDKQENTESETLKSPIILVEESETVVTPVVVDEDNDPIKNQETKADQPDEPVTEEVESDQPTDQSKAISVSDSVEKIQLDSVLFQESAKETAPLARSFFVRVDAGAGFTSKKLQSLHSDWDAHTAIRSTSEKPLEFLSGQLLVGYRLPSGFYVATGLSFTQITERFHVNRTYSETELIEDHVAEIHIDINGDSSFVYTNTLVEHHFHQEVVEYNRYTLIDLPIIAGYEWSRNKWHLGIEGGVQFNLSLRTNGRMLAPTDEIVDMDASGMFRSNVSVNYLANIRVGYSVSPRCQVFLSPGVRFISGSMLQHDVQRQSYQLYGMQIGTRFWLK